PLLTRRGTRLAPGTCRPARGDVRARDRQGGLLRSGRAPLSPPPADGLGELRRAAAPTRLRFRGGLRASRACALGGGGNAVQRGRPHALLAERAGAHGPPGAERRR